MMLYVKHNDDNVTDVIMLLFGFIVMFVLLQVSSQWQNISTKLDVWIFFYYLFFVSLTKISFEIVKEKEAISFRLINYMLLLSRMGAVKISVIPEWTNGMSERNQHFISIWTYFFVSVSCVSSCSLWAPDGEAVKRYQPNELLLFILISLTTTTTTTANIDSFIHWFLAFFSEWFFSLTSFSSWSWWWWKRY